MPERHLIKKYANRKLYDTRTSRYITLDGISELVRQGHEIEVVERETGRDLTPLILSQVVVGEEKRGRLSLAGGVSEELIGQGAALLDYVRRSLNVPASLVQSEVGRRRSDLESIVDEGIERALHRLSIPTHRDLDRLSRKLDRLAARVEAIAPAGREATRSRTRKAAG
jgi:polyhydroxyalkanoate synthesis repressor PhaR